MTSRELQLTWTLENDPRDGTFQYYTINCTSPEADLSQYNTLVLVPYSDVNYEYNVVNLTPFRMYVCCISVTTTLALSVQRCSRGMTLEDGI